MRKITMLGLACVMLSAGAQAFQLYESDSTGIKGGDLMDRDYWRAKWNNIRLDEAIQQREPEGAILMEVIGQRQLCDELIKKYPNDQDFKTWKAHAEQIEHKINPNASRGESFKPGCLWSEINYRESYVNYNYAKVAIQKKDWAAAKDGLNYAERNLTFLVDRVKKEDRVAAWPDGAAKWVQDTWTDVGKMKSEVNAKLK